MLAMELLEVEAGDVVYVTLYAEKPPEEEEGRIKRCFNLGVSGSGYQNVSFADG